MNAGQIMMQTPVNATLSVAVPATPATVTLPTGDQQATDFAGVLAGMAPQGPSQPEEVAGTAKPVGGGTSAANGISLVPMIQDAEVAIVAALQATTTKAVQTEPSEAEVGKDKAEPVEEKETEDVGMPQNVVLCASGTLVAAEQQIIGRMPEQDLGVAGQGGEHDKATLVGVVDKLKLAPVAGNTLQPAATAAEVLQKSAEAPLPGGKAASVELVRQSAVEPGAEAPHKAVQTATPARTEQAETVTIQRGVSAEQPLPTVELPEQAAGKKEMKADVQPKAAQFYASAPMTAGEPTNPNQTQVPVSQENTVGSTGVKAATSPAETAEKSVAAEQRQAATAPVHGTVAGEQSVTATVEQVAQIEIPEASADFQANAVQQRVAAKKETNAVPPLQGGDAGLLASETEDSAALAVKPMKDQAAVHPAEFRFARSAAVEVALGGSQPANLRTQEKNLPEHGNSIKIAVEQAVTEETDGGFSGSDAGSTARDFEGFIQQTPLPARPAMNNTPGVIQPFTVDTTTTTSTQALQPESFRPVSSEHIAGQVREQLGTHEIKSGSEQITIRLSPDHLGDIKVNFRLEDQRLKVEIVTENRHAKESLLQHADSLKESLARQNISMDKFDVTTSSNSGNQGNNAQGDWRELARNRQTQQWLASGGYRTQSAGEVQKPPAYIGRAEHAVLDLHF